jgi:N utilization substance protein A
VLEAIETALITAYRHTDGHQPHARIDIDRKTGLVRVMAQELAADGAGRQQWDDTAGGLRAHRRHNGPAGHPAAAARRRARAHVRRVLRQGGEIVSGVSPRDARANAAARRGRAAARSRRVLPQAEQVPAESYAHGERIRCYVVGVPGTAGRRSR